MSNLQNYKIGVLIDADASKLQAEAKKADKAIEGIGGGGFAKVKSEFGNLASEFNLIPDSASKASSTLTAMSGSVSGIAEAAGPAGIAIGALTVGITATVGVGIQLSKTLFDLAKQASDYGSQIYDASQKTGVGTETLSALKYAADTSGSSLEAVSGYVSKFARVIGENSDESKKKLTALGLDPQTAINDLDGSLAKVFQKIADAENPIIATKFATDAFGKSGANMIPVIKSFDGNLDGLIKTATNLGLVLSEKDAEAADAFGDTLDTLTKQAEGAGYEFAYGFMPQTTDAMSEISGVLADNKNDWRSWGEVIGGVLTGTIHAIGQMVRAAKADIEILAAVASGDYQTAMLLYSAYDANFQKAEQAYQLGTISGNAKIRKPQPDYDFSNSGRSSGGGKSSSKGTTKNFELSSQGKALVEASNKLGISPLDLAAIVSYETKGTFNPNVRGGKGNNYQGLIQFGPEERSKYNVYKGQSFEEQILGPVVKYFQDRFASVGKSTVGANLLDLYKTVNGGNPTVSAKASDGNGTISQHVQRIASEHYGNALNKFFGGNKGNIKGIDETEIAKRNLEELQKGIDFVQKYTESFNNLGETTHRISLEREKDFQKLAEPEKERLRLIADEWDAVEKAAKASEEYSNFIEQLSAKYDEVNGVQVTFTEQLDNQLKKLKENGVVLDDTAEGFARYRALILDVTANEQQLNDALEKQNRLRMDEREYLNGKNPGVAMPSDAARGINLDSDGPAPKIQKSVSAWGIADSRAGDFKQGGIFDENTVNTQVSLMQTLKESGMDAFRSISGEIGSAAAQWLAYGDSSEQSLGKATKAVLASVSAQALGTGLYELGLGFAALTPWGAAIYGPAPFHFKSAAILLGMGAAFGGLARAAPGGDSKGKSGGSSSVSSSSTSQPDNRQYNFLRDSSIGSNQTQANNQLQLTVNELRASVQQLTAANKDLQSRINTQPAGVLVANGIKENRGLVSETVISEMSKNSTTANQFGRILGAN